MTQDPEITCPVCGDNGFDRGGLVRHIDRYCEEGERLRNQWADEDAERAERYRAQHKASLSAIVDTRPKDGDAKQGDGND